MGHEAVDAEEGFVEAEEGVGNVEQVMNNQASRWDVWELVEKFNRTKKGAISKTVSDKKLVGNRRMKV